MMTKLEDALFALSGVSALSSERAVNKKYIREVGKQDGTCVGENRNRALCMKKPWNTKPLLRKEKNRVFKKLF